MRRLAAGLVLGVLGACVTIAPQPNPEEMRVSASALTKLAAAMEALVRYDSPAPGQAEAQLLEQGTRHDPALLRNLDRYDVRVMASSGHAVVLLCSKENRRALLEDAGCTGKLDVQHWDKPAQACEFTLQPATVCGSAK